MKKFWKQEKKQEEVLEDMQTAENIRLMKVIEKNAEEGKPEAENLIILKELNMHAAIKTEEEKAKTEKSNRRSWLEKTGSTISPFVVIGCAIWSANKDSKGEITTRSTGGKQINTMLNSIAAKFSDIKNWFFKK